ncbi:MAG: aldo/keto reductase [Bacteriovoracaceae bacterium]
MMEYRNLGNTGLFVSSLSFGTWVTFKTQVDLPLSTHMMELAYERGVNFFDNAETYADGDSEVIMGKSLKELNWDRSTYIVSSKVFWGGKKPTQLGLSRKHVIEACHQSLKRFGLDYIDLFYCHRPDKDTAIVETVRAMDTLIKQGKILYWGTSEWETHQIVEAYEVAERLHLTPPSVEQPQYNLFERNKVEKQFLPLYKKYGMGLTTWSPLSSGILTGKYKNGVPENSRLSLEHLAWLKDHFFNEEGQQKLLMAKELGVIAKELGLSLAKMSIAWCLKNPHVSSVILGASSMDQLNENLDSIDCLPILNDKVMARIENVIKNKPSEDINFKDF